MRIGILTLKRENSRSQTDPTSVNSLHNVPLADLLGEDCPLASRQEPIRLRDAELGGRGACFGWLW